MPRVTSRRTISARDQVRADLHSECCNGHDLTGARMPVTSTSRPMPGGMPGAVAATVDVAGFAQRDVPGGRPHE
jgi:hypothetical protein